MAKTVELPPATASSSKLASTAGTTTADPALAAAKAVSELYTFFHRGKVAYTFNDRTVQRYYCRACLNNEIKVIREAREQFGQGANAPVEVLRDIGTSSDSSSETSD